MRTQINRIAAHTARYFRPAIQTTDPPKRRPTRKVRMQDNRISGWFLEEQGQICEGFTIDSSDTVVDVGCGEGRTVAEDLERQTD